MARDVIDPRAATGAYDYAVELVNGSITRRDTQSVMTLAVAEALHRLAAAVEALQPPA